MIDRTVFRQVRLPLRFKWIAIGWLAAEILVFAALVHVLGFGTTVLLGFATTVLGVVMMRRLGTETLAGLRVAAGGGPRPEAMLDGMIAGLGALLLIVPGFLANFAGLALASPSVRRQAMRRFGALPGAQDGRLRRTVPGVIDLEPSDWRPVDRP